jgi:hypothetical protein
MSGQNRVRGTDKISHHAPCSLLITRPD